MQKSISERAPKDLSSAHLKAVINAHSSCHLDRKTQQQ
ncbi:hypothetical protein C4J98_2780 [Pseudomonas orientalis]|nr:hypothetical protein C4J98_2780 [Pseudomonas orientalis]